MKDNGVIEIPAFELKSKGEDGNEKKKRVAAYCRVSTGPDEQLNSYEVQVDEWKKRISEHENEELVEIYADEGISGTGVEHREQFQRMIKDCQMGKIDLIYCKSVSRFARNTLDFIKTIRDLKS